MKSFKSGLRSGIATKGNNFIAPEASDPYFSNVALLLSGAGNNNNNIIDSSLSPKTITVTGNVEISTAQSRFGARSILINGGTIESNSSLDFAFGSGDFTIEGWMYLLTPTTGFQDIFRTTDNLLYLNFRENGALGLTTANAVIALSPLPIPLNQWSYFAATKSDSTFRVFLNGISGTPVTNPNLTFATNATEIRCGGAFSPLNAYIDQYRITKGVAREITVPSGPFPNR